MMMPCDQAAEAAQFIATTATIHPTPRTRIRLMVFSPLAFGTRAADPPAVWASGPLVEASRLSPDDADYPACLSSIRATEYLPKGISRRAADFISANLGNPGC